ncbi:hypothetical protein HU200_029182 [Digitaria exilis]|uniref:Uncharacterized protein n=1 Tax=Digitaria exilis TaxID=1010633 RepID=A0A835BUA7_9POAL|nr:hypothetical protein HU200_029182 [Digitaria exilis]
MHCKLIFFVTRQWAELHKGGDKETSAGGEEVLKEITLHFHPHRAPEDSV